jgi:hypothetical protein
MYILIVFLHLIILCDIIVVILGSQFDHASKKKNNNNNNDNNITNSHALFCRQQHGRVCTSHELSHPHITVPSGHAVHLVNELFADHPVTKLYLDTSLNVPQIVGGALLIADGHLWMYAEYFLTFRRPEDKKKCPAAEIYPNPLILSTCDRRKSQYLTNGMVFTIYFKLNEHLQLLPNEPIHFIPLERIDYEWSQRTKYFTTGFEDARTFLWGDESYIALTSQPSWKHDRTFTDGFARCMYIQRVWPTLGTALELKSVSSTLQLESSEKNWSPTDIVRRGNDLRENKIIHDPPMLFARFINPHQMLHCWKNGSCIDVATSNRDAYFAAFMKRGNWNAVHLGSNAITVSSTHYCAIMHGVRFLGGKRWHAYGAYVYLFQRVPPYAIEFVSTGPLALPRSGRHHVNDYDFVWVQGLAWIDGRIVITYMDNLVTSSVYITLKEDLLSNLEAVYHDVN